MPFFDRIEHAEQTEVGVRRSHNQDAVSVQLAVDREHWDRHGHIFVVADGMGGHAVGEKASAKAVGEIPLTYLKHAHEGALVALRRAFLEANAGIHAIGQSNPEFRGMGTTATALVLREEGAWVGHVGDSRAYRVRDGYIDQLSFDHSYAWEMARRLGVAPEELADVKKNVIIRSLGPDALVQVDIEGPYPLRPGDVFVLCSDGLSNPVTPEEIGTVVSALPPQEAARFLIELANLRGGPDNISVVVVKVGTSETVADGAAGGKKSSAGRKLVGLLKRVPWPLGVLSLGFLLAVLSVVCAVGQVPGSAALFVAAAVAIGVGLIGLGVHTQQERKRQLAEPEEPVRQNIYRQHPCRIERGLVDKVAKLDAHLRDHMRGRNWVVDWASYQTLHDAAERSMREGDLMASFREHCRALLGLARAFNKHRHKEEGFRPKWETTAES